jgi:hypothetical protein
VASYFISIRYRDSRAFLSAMLEREEPEEREARDIDSFSVDPEDCAFLVQVLHGSPIVSCPSFHHPLAVLNVSEKE